MEETSYLDQLKEQHKAFCAQRDLAQNNLQQLVGAIYACEMMIAKMESDRGAVADVETHESKTESVVEG